MDAGPALRRIGVPCIVEAAVPVPGIETFCTVGERVMLCFLHHRGIGTDHDSEMEGYVQEPVGGERIRRIIRRDDPDFERLTACSEWLEPPS